MSFQELMNSSLLWILVIAGIASIMGIAMRFTKKAWNRALEIGITKETLIRVAKSSAVFAIVPSIAIVVGLFALTTLIGSAWAWFRLSVIGSVMYELIAADMALTAVGVTPATAGGSDFVLVMYVMSIVASIPIITAIIASKKIQQGTVNAKNKDKKWGVLLNATLMPAFFCVTIIPIVLGFNIELLTLITSMCVAVLVGFIAKKTGKVQLNNFTLSLALLIGMLSSIVWTNLLG